MCSQKHSEKKCKNAKMHSTGRQVEDFHQLNATASIGSME